MKPSMTALAAVTLVLALPSTRAAEVEFAKPKPDTANFLGDRIDFGSRLLVRKTVLGSKQPTDACVPTGTVMQGTGRATVSDNGKSEDYSLFKVRSVPEHTKSECPQDLVAANDTVLISPELLRNSPPNRYGWAFGTLAVPYKYQLRGDRSLSGGATLGGYFGYRATVLGTGTQWVVFSGATKVDVPTTKDGRTTTESLAGFSYGVGVLGSIKDAFQVGLVVGADRVNKSAGYVNNGKPWISLSLGYDFFH